MQAGRFYTFKRKTGAETTLGLLAVSALLVFLSAGRRLPAQPYPQRKPVPAATYAEGWQQDLRLFEKHWNALLTDRQSEDQSRWTTLENELRGSAKRFDQHLEEHMRRAKAGVPGSASAPPACTVRDDVPGYRCYLFAGPKGVCRYICAPLKK